MKKLLVISLIALAMVSCEQNLLSDNEAKKLSVAGFIYSGFGTQPENFDWQGTYHCDVRIMFADDYRCCTSYDYFNSMEDNGRGKFETNDYYYELKYPYITLYNVSAFFIGEYVGDSLRNRALTKEELQLKLNGKAGVLKFTNDSTNLTVEEAYSSALFFSFTKRLRLENRRITDPTSLFPIPPIP